ncbi:predicted protein [Naegleria gruberi]|uniref:Predicted protein n=1 Tax=Naegleria gruberi TaxID=5762 RepID=D2VF47_NAEGR|nr:uncharacterized protein NAEGRDRAFT_67498 [Naegleria gruberi]EFC44620.1 predicted protein [Naegleria gruberi]|eukprot:XP_002677364.1 predicted protein [Naegleria gruberi strain NEG-M]
MQQQEEGTSREIILTSDLATNESIIQSKIPSKFIFAFGASKILHSARISLLDSERLSNLRYLILSDEAIYIFDDQDFERRIPNEHISEIVKSREPSVSSTEQKSHRILIRVHHSNEGSDLIIISKGATGVLEAFEKAKYTFTLVDPSEDLFSMARFVSDNAQQPSIDSLKQHLDKALQSSDLKNTMLYLETLRRNKHADWENDELISKAIEFVKSK